MILRITALATIVLLVCGIAFAAPGRASARAQTVEPTKEFEWQEIPTLKAS